MAAVALITGGTSGIGYDVAKRLSETGSWQVHILGTNKERGEKAASSLQNTTYHQANVGNYQELASTFDKAFNSSGRRLDFVFANAGKTENINFYARHPENEIPPEPNFDLVDINITAVMYTSYLALHYFRLSPEMPKGKKSLVITSSIGGLYPSSAFPAYSCTKHSLIGFTRAVAPSFWADGIRINTFCPGLVDTGFCPKELEYLFPPRVWIPMSKCTDIVSSLMGGGDMVDSKGVKVPDDELYSKIVQVSGMNHYFFEIPELQDEEAKITFKGMMGGE